MFIDAHIHIDRLYECVNKYEDFFLMPYGLCFCGSTSHPNSFEQSLCICKEKHIQNAFFSFGIHPQEAGFKNMNYLESLCEENRIIAIGEIGFDFFDEKLKKSFDMQRKVWNYQVKLAQKFSKPIVVHCRKSLPYLFENISVLKHLESVIFHGWSGSVIEARSFLKKGVNAFFSIGKALLRGQKSVIDMATNFDMNRLLTETDAPFMTLKDEVYSKSIDIVDVVNSVCKYSGCQQKEFLAKVENNFEQAFDCKLCAC